MEVDESSKEAFFWSAAPTRSSSSLDETEFLDIVASVGGGDGGVGGVKGRGDDDDGTSDKGGLVVEEVRTHSLKRRNKKQ